MLENIQSTKRVAFLDVMKGIGILLVCLGHSVSTMAHPLNMFVLSFHMPLFLCFRCGIRIGCPKVFQRVRHQKNAGDITAVCNSGGTELWRRLYHRGCNQKADYAPGSVL